MQAKNSKKHKMLKIFFVATTTCSNIEGRKKV